MVDSPFFVQTQEQKWETYLNYTAAVAPGLELWRRGDTTTMRSPLESWLRLQTPLPHPAHHDYSSIATAKRKMEEHERMEARKRNRNTRYIQGIPIYRSIPPDDYIPFQRAVPDIRHFTKPLRIRIPKWVL